MWVGSDSFNVVYCILFVLLFSLYHDYITNISEPKNRARIRAMGTSPPMTKVTKITF